MAPRRRKRAKNSNIASPNVVLKALVGMPMDIIFEIFGHLDPLDLVRLARTTKTLRAMLISRSSLALWKRVRHAYYQMPDGPDGMSEPQYVSLALDDTCYGCGLAVSHVYTFWNAQLKSCGECQSALLVTKSNLKKFNLSEALPSWLILLLDDPNIGHLYSLNQAQIWSQQYVLLSGSSAKLEWEAQIIKKDALTKKHIASFRSWVFARDREIAAEHARLIEAMEKELFVKLEELGWGEEISKIPSYERGNLPTTLFINKPKSFSQAWSLNGPSVLEALKAIRDTRLEKERKILLSSRYKVLQEIYNEYIRGIPADVLIPNVADVALFPPVHAIITDERTDFTVTQQTFENVNLVQNLPSIISDWKIRLDDELVRMMQDALSVSITTDHLLLATTVFYCDACRIMLFYPRVLVHQCSFPAWNYSKSWNSSRSIKFNRDVHQAVIDILVILDLDPNVVTAEDMTARNSVLQCLDCRKTRQGRMTMIWSRAVEHSRKRHKCSPSITSWKVPGHQGQLTLQASLAQDLVESDYSEWVQPRFMCGRCRQKERLVWLQDHLLAAHGVKNPGKGDILLHPDADHAPMPCVLPEVD